jgi:predicted DCC family thiol-disulfide oxidoreductase YuxK
MASPEKIVFFDGFCVFCNATVDWLLQRDARDRLKFAPLQGKTAQARLSSEIARRASPDSIVYLRDGAAYERSTAFGRVLIELGGFWHGIGALILIVPRPLRDFAYDLFARNRYRLFGRRDTCRLPTPAERARLLD